MKSKQSTLAALAGLAAVAGAAADASAALGFNVAPGGWPSAAHRNAAVGAAQAAVNRYNAYGDFGNHNVHIYYNAGIPTAQANYLGSVGFGGAYPNERVMMHEFAHYLGSGTYGTPWDGPRGEALVDQFDGLEASLNGDGAHFWPYGLNYDNEGSEINKQRHAALLYAQRADMGIGSAANPWTATVVRLTASDASGESGFNYARTWSDNRFAHAGATYFTDAHLLRTPASGNSFHFVGDSVRVNNTNGAAGGLAYKGFGTTGVISFRDLILQGGYVRHSSGAGDLFQLGGRVTLAGPATIDAAGGNIRLTGTVGGGGSLNKVGGHTLTLTAANSYSGLTHVNGGTLAINGQWALGGSAYGGMTFNGGTLQYAPNLTGANGTADVSQTSLGTPRPVTFNAGGATIDTNGNSVTYAYGVGGGGPGGLTKVGAGTLSLAGFNTYAGATTVRAGTFRVTGGALGSAADGAHLALAPAAGDAVTMTVTGAAAVGADRVVVAGNVANNAGGAATLTQTGGTINSRRWFTVGSVGSGTFNMSGGTVNQNGAGGTQLEVAAFGAGHSTMNVRGDARVNVLNGGSFAVGVVNNTGSGTVNQDGGAVTFYADDGATVGGAGKLVLGQGAPTGTYTYHLNGGTLTTGGVTRNPTAAAAGARGVFNFNGGTLKPTADSAAFVHNLTAANVMAGGALIDTDGKNLTIAQPLLDGGGGGGLAKRGAGTLTLAARNTYTGATTVNAGTLAFGASQRLGALNVGAGAAAAIAPGAPATLVIGSLSITGAPGEGSGTLDLAGGAAAVDYVGSSSPLPTLADQVRSAFRGGAWDGAGITSSLADAAHVGVGYAESASGFGAAGGTFGGEAVDGSAVLLRAVRYGDADLDGVVNADDLLILRRNLGATGARAVWQNGDFDYDGRIGARDLMLLRSNFGLATPAVSTLSVLAVPEPGAAAALAPLAALALSRRRRRAGTR